MQDDDPVDALRSLELQVEPPAALERLIVRRLKATGSIRGSYRYRRFIAAAAVLLTVFAAGWTLGRNVEQGTPRGDRYVLFIYGQVSAPGADLVAEYTAWARAARNDGRQLTGERLETQSAVFGGGDTPSDDNVRGYFVFTAATADDAMTLARSHPHVRRGGRVVLHRIVPTS